MKGPGLRLDIDVRRVWRCAVCGTERHTRGATTLVACHFCQDHPLMSLVEPRRLAAAQPPPLDPVIDLHPDDVDATPFVPVHLRDPEDVPSPPTDTEMLDVPPQTRPVEVEPPPEIKDETATEAESSAANEPNQSRNSRRKKSRRKRKRRKGERGQQTTDGSRSSTPETTPPDSPQSADNSFGAGLDP